MTEQKTATRNTLVWFALIICMLVFLATCGGAYLWQRMQYQQLNDKISRLNESTQLNQAKYTDITNSINNLQQKLNDNQAQLDKLLTNNKAVGLYEINELVGIANQQLLLYSNIKGALNVLSYTQQLINSNDAPDLVELKLALAKDILKLQNENGVDSTNIVATLETLHQDIVMIPLITDISDADKLQLNQGKTKWQQLYTNVINGLLSLVRVTPVASGTKDLALMANSELLVRQNIEFQFLSAKLALFTHNQLAYTSSLANIKLYLTNYFQVTPLASVSQKRLSELMDSNISIGDININATLTALSHISR